MSLDFVERLKREILEKAQVSGDQGAEIGGLLLGSFSTNQGDVEIRGFQILPCENRSDRRYILSTPDDVERLEVAVAAPYDGLAVVGSFRSHLRDGLNLDDRDLTVCQIWFSDPAFIFLVVKPSPDGACDAGFFFWDRGQVHAAFSFMEFPFDAVLLRRAMERAPRSDEDLLEPSAEQPTAPAAPLPRARDRQRHVGRWMIATGILAAALLGVGYQYSRQRFAWFGGAGSAARRSSPLGLRVETHGSDLVITWNRQSREVRTARSGALLIADGDQSRQEIHLTPAELLNGSIVYAPISGRVQFRLDVEGEGNSRASELVLAIIRSDGPATGAPTAVAKAERSAEKILGMPGAAAHAAPNPVPASVETRSATPRPVRTFVPPSRASTTEASPRVFVVDPPAVQPDFSLPAAAGPAVLSQLRLPDPPPPAPESPPPAKTVPEIKPAPRVSSYVQPRVLHREQPQLPSMVFRTMIAQEMRVEVEVKIDAAGKVTDAKIVSGPVRNTISSAVITAAKKWTFAPAQSDGQLIPSGTRILFEFRPTSNPR